MIIEGQIHGGLTEAFAHRHGPGDPLRRRRQRDDRRRSWTSSCRPRSRRRIGRPTGPTTPSPHHPIGAKGVGESPNVGGVPCFSNAVNDAFCVPRLDPHPDAARPLAHLDGGEASLGLHRVSDHRPVRAVSGAGANPGAALPYNGCSMTLNSRRDRGPAGRRRLYRRPRARDRAVADGVAEAPAAARRRGRRRQDRGGQGARRRARRPS